MSSDKPDFVEVLVEFLKFMQVHNCKWNEAGVGKSISVPKGSVIFKRNTAIGEMPKCLMIFNMDADLVFRTFNHNQLTLLDSRDCESVMDFFAKTLAMIYHGDQVTIQVPKGRTDEFRIIH